jgi:hypothetical protein
MCPLVPAKVCSGLGLRHCGSCIVADSVVTDVMKSIWPEMCVDCFRSAFVCMDEHSTSHFWQFADASFGFPIGVVCTDGSERKALFFSSARFDPCICLEYTIACMICMYGSAMVDSVSVCFPGSCLPMLSCEGHVSETCRLINVRKDIVPSLRIQTFGQQVLGVEILFDRPTRLRQVALA